MIEYTQTPPKANGHKNLFFHARYRILTQKLSPLFVLIPLLLKVSLECFFYILFYATTCKMCQQWRLKYSVWFYARNRILTQRLSLLFVLIPLLLIIYRFGALFHILLYALHCITFTCAISRVQTHRMLRLKQINHRLMFHFLSFSSKQSSAKGVIRRKSKLFRRRGSLFSWGHKSIISFQKYNMRGFCCIKPYTRLL